MLAGEKLVLVQLTAAEGHHLKINKNTTTGHNSADGCLWSEPHATKPAGLECACVSLDCPHSD